jgi:ABC-type nitrate/sulfonate/bicarbonate transport system substrate-binding protein
MRKTARTLLPLLVVCLFSSVGVAADRARVVYGSLVAGHMVMYAAKEFGLFQKYDVDAEIVGHIPGAKALVPLLSGDAQFVHAAGPPFVLGTLGGADVVIFLSLAETLPYYLLVRSDISNAAQLKGKKLGVTTFGSSSDFSLRFGLRKLGLDPERDVSILAIGDTATRSGALSTGVIQGGSYTIGETILLKRMGYRVLLDMAATGLVYQHTAVATTRSFIGRNRRIVVNYAKAIIDGVRQMKERKEDSLKVLAKYLRVNDREYLEAQYQENAHKLYSKKPYPTLAGVKTILDSLAAKEPKARQAKPEQFVDLSIIEELDRSGFIDGLYR